ncbi:hypothetical protein PFISCL1PPCAC_13831, partial [Pristionchus fissidentatus]
QEFVSTHWPLDNSPRGSLDETAEMFPKVNSLLNDIDRWDPHLKMNSNDMTPFRTPSKKSNTSFHSFISEQTPQGRYHPYRTNVASHSELSPNNPFRYMSSGDTSPQSPPLHEQSSTNPFLMHSDSASSFDDLHRINTPSQKVSSFHSPFHPSSSKSTCMEPLATSIPLHTDSANVATFRNSTSPLFPLPDTILSHETSLSQLFKGHCMERKLIAAVSRPNGTSSPEIRITFVNIIKDYLIENRCPLATEFVRPFFVKLVSQHPHVAPDDYIHNSQSFLLKAISNKKQSQVKKGKMNLRPYRKRNDKSLRIHSFRKITIEQVSTIYPQYFSDISIVRDDFVEMISSEKNPNMLGYDIEDGWLVRAADHCEANIDETRLQQLVDSTSGDPVLRRLVPILDVLDNMHKRRTAHSRARHRLIFQSFTFNDPDSAVASLHASGFTAPMLFRVAGTPSFYIHIQGRAVQSPTSFGDSILTLIGYVYCLNLEYPPNTHDFYCLIESCISMRKGVKNAYGRMLYNALINSE